VVRSCYLCVRYSPETLKFWVSVLRNRNLTHALRMLAAAPSSINNHQSSVRLGGQRR
jgi:hypothetical protein